MRRIESVTGLCQKQREKALYKTIRCVTMGNAGGDTRVHTVRQIQRRGIRRKYYLGAMRKKCKMESVVVWKQLTKEK